MRRAESRELRVFEPPHGIQICAAVSPVQDATALSVTFEEFEVNIINDDCLNIRSTFRGNRISAKGDIRWCVDAGLGVLGIHVLDER